MQCGVKRKHNYLDSEHHKSLLELSIHKLQEEQAKYGIEPRLHRFVLINNALKSLQVYLSKLETDNFYFFDSDSHDFLANTLNHGILSSPVSPPTPVKVSRFDSNLFSSSSPLVNSSSSSSLSVNETVDTSEYGLTPLSPYPVTEATRTKDSSPKTGSKRKSDSQSISTDTDDTDDDGEDPIGPSSSKKLKVSSVRPRSLSLGEDPLPLSSSSSLSSSPSSNNSISRTDDHISSDDSISSSLSPIDFSNVDVSLYDFDARAALTLPPVATTPRNPIPSSLSISSSATGTYIEPVVDNSPQTEGCDKGSVECNSEISSTTGTTTVLSSSSDVSDSSSILGVSNETSEVENLDEIDRIVSLLMT